MQLVEIEQSKVVRRRGVSRHWRDRPRKSDERTERLEQLWAHAGHAVQARETAKRTVRIVAWRAAHGPFGSLARLDSVPGVGPKLLESLGPFVTFSGAITPMP